MKDLNTKIYFLFLFLIGMIIIVFFYDPPLYFLPKQTTGTSTTSSFLGGVTLPINVPTIAGSLPAPIGYRHYVTVGNTTVYVELADTPERRADGLGGRSNLPQNAGMFFIFDKADYHGIWMRNMLFPIDINWFDDAKTVIQIDKRVAPETYPNIFSPNRPARYALEVNAGFADSFAITVGQSITRSE